MENHVSNRFKHLLNVLNLKLTEMSKKTGIPYPTLQDYIAGKRKPGAENLKKIMLELHVSSDWLLTGEGPMFLDRGEREPPRDDFAYVKKLRVVLSAGGGSLEIDETAEHVYAFRKSYLKTIGPIDKMYLMEVRGDSMEPTLADGDLVLIDTSRRKIRPGIFALRIDNEAYIKRLQPLGGGRLSVISDNRLYPPQTLDLQKDPVAILGQVVWFGRTLVRGREEEEEEEE